MSQVGFTACIPQTNKIFQILNSMVLIQNNILLPCCGFSDTYYVQIPKTMKKNSYKHIGKLSDPYLRHASTHANLLEAHAPKN